MLPPQGSASSSSEGKPSCDTATACTFVTPVAARLHAKEPFCCPFACRVLLLLPICMLGQASVMNKSTNASQALPIITTEHMLLWRQSSQTVCHYMPLIVTCCIGHNCGVAVHPGLFETMLYCLILISQSWNYYMCDAQNKAVWRELFCIARLMPSG